MGELRQLTALGVDYGNLVWNILDQSPDCIKVLSPLGELEYMNPNGRVAMEIDDFAQVSGQPLADLWPEESRPLLRDAIYEAALGQKSRFEAYCPTAKGNPRWWEVSVSPIRAADGRVSHVLCSSRDLSWWKEEELRKEAADGHAMHRARNHLAAIGALARLSLGGDPLGKQVSARLLDRLERLTSVFDLISDRATLIPLGGIVDRSLSKMRGDPSCRIDPAPKVMVDSDTARTVAIVLGELEANAIAHGALSSLGGRVDLALMRDCGQLVFAWRETLNAAPTTIEPANGLRLATRLSAGMAEPLTVEVVPGGLLARFAIEVT